MTTFWRAQIGTAAAMQDEILQDMPYAKNFAPVDENRWRELAIAALKGRPIESLDSKTYDDIKIHPLYRAGQALSQSSRKPGLEAVNHWSVMARVDCPDGAKANALLLSDLENGADGLSLIMDGAIGAYGFGLKTPEDLERALQNVRLDYGVAVEIDAPTSAPALALAKWVETQNFDARATKISFGLDPVSAIIRASESGSAGDRAKIEQNFIEAFRFLKSKNFAGPIAVADARPIHAAGGTEAQEIVFALGAALHILRLLEQNGFGLEEARDAIAFRVALDADEFLSIAKLRALRGLWTRVQKACGLSPQAALIHGETAWRMTTRRDPYVNILRATVAVFSGAVGGADRISALPFTQALGLPDSFARRIARNAQLVLAQESNLDKVLDPAAGAGGFEALTQALEQKAWDLFQAQESAGGLLQSIGDLSKAVSLARKEREKNLARRKDAVTGVSEFPHLAEEAPHVLAPAPAQSARSNALFPAMRLAQSFEDLREKSDALAAKGARAKIFLANLGPISAFNARATFAKNFLEAGGFETLGNDGFKNPQDGADAFAQSGAAIACICSSDALYAEQAEFFAQALKDKGAKGVLLAGRPGQGEDALRKAGVDDFIFAGADVLAALRKIWGWFD